MDEQEAIELKALMDESDHVINAQVVQYERGRYAVAYQDSVTKKPYRMSSPHLWQMRCEAARRGWLEGRRQPVADALLHGEF